MDQCNTSGGDVDGGNIGGKDRAERRYLCHRQTVRLYGAGGGCGHHAPRYAGGCALRCGKPPYRGNCAGAGGGPSAGAQAQADPDGIGRRASSGRQGPSAGAVDAGAVVLHGIRRGQSHAASRSVLLPSGPMGFEGGCGSGDRTGRRGQIGAGPPAGGAAVCLGWSGGCAATQGGLWHQRSQSRTQTAAGQGNSHPGDQCLPGRGG